MEYFLQTDDAKTEGETMVILLHVTVSPPHLQLQSLTVRLKGTLEGVDTRKFTSLNCVII